ncbi:MAG: inositol monophosphatase [Anaerolineae bacterium]|jgi:myo-inositol-1(or 4)-monophosphatase|nr:inositol monophosphatase [Anaerolineae bacterium]MBT7069897.1 inositol monophosphatase [Anaerolineae bacterium]MBT7323872.1 inositol monophosphatase [Anaerolineae bacterium]
MIEPTIQDLETLACQAGEILRAGYNKKHDIQYKGIIDLVTEIDGQSEEFLIHSILQKFPGHHILAEESGGVDGDHEHSWYIDPLDGTVNYAHRIPIFSVSIGYARAGTMELATVYDPMRGEVFSAERGRGAYLNGERLQASGTSELEKSLLVTGFPYDIRTTPDDNLTSYGRFAKLTQGVRRLGSAALDLCYIGAGRFDGYWERSLQPWDLAAGALIAEEAGAKVTDIDGKPDYLTSTPSVIAAQPILHEKILAVLKEEKLSR